MIAILVGQVWVCEEKIEGFDRGRRKSVIKR